ncbi:MAG: hypothetical protein ABEI96_06275 [Haloarculaceae archaeon]
MHASGYADRIDELADAAAAARESFEPPADPPDEERAMELLREGFGPTVVVYLDARTGDEMPRFGREEFDRLERASDTWLSLYAACYGEDVDVDVPVRTAAELLMETHNVKDVAQVLTDVPPRRG